MVQEQHNALPRGYELDGYRFESILGSGGFGITYKATEIALKRTVAIKEYLPGGIAMRGRDGIEVHAVASADETDFAWGLDRYRREAQLLTGFRHPNIILAHRFMEANGTAYLVMEYEEGESLAARLKREGTLPEDEIRSWLDPLLDGLEQVHEAGLLHRDVTPGNIYIRADGSPVLLDFGGARQALSHKSQSLTSLVTPGYAPHEQYETDGDQGAWTDIYAVGAVLYRAVTGQRPREATKRIGAVARNQPDPLVPAASAAAAGEYSPVLLYAIDQSLAVIESDRPRDITALRALLAAASVPRKGGRATLAWVAVAALVVLVVAAGGIIKWTYDDGPETVVARLPAPEASTTPAKPATVKRPEPKPKPKVKKKAEPKPPAKPKPTPEETARARREAERAAVARCRTFAAEKSMVQAALEWCLKAAELGSSVAQVLYGRFHETGNGVARDYRTAMKWYRRAAAQGYHVAQSRVGDMYAQGLGVRRDYFQSFKWRLKAADQGYVGPQTLVGVMYERGLGVPRNFGRARGWYERAARKKYPQAEYRLGLLHINGRGVPVSYSKGLGWLHCSAGRGFAPAENAAGLIHARGLGVPRNRAKALRWFRLAAAQGYAPAQNNLGAMFEKGHGVRQSFREAYRWYRRAAGQGYAVAQANIGALYAKGLGVPQDYRRSFTWRQRAAAKGHASAQRALAYMYELGQGMPRNPSEAFFWYSLAVRGGDPVARQALAGLKRHLTARAQAKIKLRVASWRPSG